MKYEYINENEIQYDVSAFEEGKPVKARYRRSKNSMDEGNPFIEALPMCREGKETIKAYTLSVNGMLDSIGENRSNMLSHVSLLRQIRFPLPFHQELEEECYTALVNAYRSRHIMMAENINLNIMQGNQEEITHQTLVGNVASATDAGFHMLGYSGCGKSSALSILLSNYPQYIVHENSDGTRFPQITYLVVTCQTNSNFKALYESIGNAIDRALGNIIPVYEKEIQKAGSLAGKAKVVRRFIELFAVGIIIFDEIQLIDFNSTKENSFEGLMTLANQTKVAIAVVGTEDAYSKMFTKLRTSRRLGSEIKASLYCENQVFFEMLAVKLFKYQWFEEKVKLTKEMVETLYTLSCGIIDQLIGIYMYMTIDYLKAEKKPIVDKEYIKKIVDKHYPGIQSVLTDMINPLNDAKRVEIVRNANEKMAEAMDVSRQEKFSELITESLSETIDKEEKIAAVIEAITMVTDDYNIKTIKRETESVLKTKSGFQMDIKELVRHVLKRLKNKATDKRPSVKRAPKITDDKHIQMKEFVETEG